MAKRKYKNPFFRIGFVLLAVLIALEAWLYTQPLLAIKPSLTNISGPSTGSASLAWPATGQAALSIPTYGVFITNGAQKAVPTASVAKIILALSILKQKPLKVGEAGPTLTLGTQDLTYYQNAVNQDGSVVAVANGEQISEYEALEAMLLPSANNMADSLAVWAFGSISAYTSFANNYVEQLGATSTHLADASGFDPATVSTASDLTKIASAVMAEPALTDLVSKYQATVPVAGTVYNTNWLLDTDGVVGIKTGNTDQAGGCYMFAANRTVMGQKITVLGSVLGDYSLGSAITDARALIDSVDTNFAKATVVHKNQVAATYAAPWGSSAKAIAASDLNIVVWKGQKASLKINAQSIKAPANTGSLAGLISASSHGKTVQTNLALNNKIQKPPLLWRLLRIKP